MNLNTEKSLTLNDDATVDEEEGITERKTTVMYIILSLLKTQAWALIYLIMQVHNISLDYYWQANSFRSWLQKPKNMLKSNKFFFPFVS